MGQPTNGKVEDMGEVGGAGAAKDVVATRTISGGIAGLNNTLTVREDGTLRLVDLRFGEDETRKVARERLQPLRDALSGPEWQSVAKSYGTPVADGFQTVIEGGGKHVTLEDGPGPAETPRVVSEVLGLLEGLWTSQGGTTGSPSSPQPNFFDLSGRGVKVAYGEIRARGEFLDYSDGERTVSLSAREGGAIESRESSIGTMVTVDLNREEVPLDVPLITLTLLLPKFNLDGSSTIFETVAIRTTHLDTGFRPGPVEGGLQSYEPLRLRGTAGHAD